MYIMRFCQHTVLRSCGLNVRLVQNAKASTLKEMKESLLIIKATEWQMKSEAVQEL